MPIRLDERLTAVAALIDGGTVADIGCDHGKLGYYLLGKGKADKIIAADISKPSLEKARLLAAENGVSQLMEMRLGDGLKPISDGEADYVVIAGLGGDVIAEIILSAYNDGKRFDNYILSPNTHPEKVRAAIMGIGQNIVYDDIVFASSKAYWLIKASVGTESGLDEAQLKFGKFYKTANGFKKYAELQLEKLYRIQSLNGESKELSEKIDELKNALE